jgi:uncharacterized protein (TIGR03435 family)
MLLDEAGNTHRGELVDELMQGRISTTVVLAFAATGIFAQVTAPAEFEVASVRPNTLDDRVVTIDVGPGGRFVARGYSLKLLVQRAFGIKGFQISGGPAWLDADRFDVVAKAPATVTGDLTEDQLRPMLQALLIDRFKLRFHRVQKELPGFALALAGNGSKLKRSAITSEQSERVAHRRGAALVAEGITMKTFATMMGSYLSRPVTDETGLKGLYDFEIAWNERADQVPSEQGGVSLISALRDQLGLKLTTRQVMVETLMIDSAEKASPN